VKVAEILWVDEICHLQFDLRAPIATTDLGYAARVWDKECPRHPDVCLYAFGVAENESSPIGRRRLRASRRQSSDCAFGENGSRELQ
jgi:hypothetical protein